MSTTPIISLGSSARAQPSLQVVLDSVQYTLQQLRSDAEFVLFRGIHTGLGEAGRPSILVRSPVADPAPSACLRRMQEEYALRSELDPAYVVRCLSLVRADGRPMLVLEDPGGTPLDLLLKDAMDIGQFLGLAISTAAALAHVHSRGLVHKDIKPANILVNTTRDHAWLMGLGMTSRLPRERQSGQHSELLVGTLAYIAPEQTGRMNRSIDSRSDLYALGVTFYEMLTGTLPFTASDPMELVHCHIARRPTPPCERLKSVPAAISAIIMKLLAKTAEERYQTAAGLETDLRRCLAEWETQQRINEFPLGEHDTPDRLLIPEKLYGRESEIKALLAAFDRVVAGGKPELVLVSGYSGIGKSSVVNELHKSLVPPRGLFASGKFDQYKRDIPYSTLAQAFQSLIRPLLSRSEGELSSWRDALHDALGPNGRLIVNLVPELQLIIGEPPPVPELPLQEGQRRFQLVLRRFIGVFASSEHPLALFLDDLQWLDSATLDWIEDLLTQSDVRHLMLIGAYRDNEVDSFHPLRARLDAIRKAGAPVQEIVLGSLTRDDLAGLITDSLHGEPERATGLAALIHEKTAGNPFSAIQFISALVEEGLVAFDYAAGRWAWDLNRIRAKGYTDNVVDLLVGKLNRLPIETQHTLQLLGCMGNSSEFALLEMVSQQSSEKLHGQLWEAIRAGLIFRTDQSYKFLHDRVQEAAYSLLPEDIRAETHLRIGRLLAACISAEKRAEAIFEIVNQLNRGSHLITSAEERKGLAELNLIAGKRAKSSTAYASALSYLRAARALLTDKDWDEDYGLIFSIEYETAEWELLTADMVAAENRLSMLAERAKRAHDVALVTRLRVTLYTILGRSDRGIEVCFEYLRSGGTDWSLHPTRDEVVREYDRIWCQLGSRKIEELVDLPVMTDPEVLDTLDLLSEIIVPAHSSDDNLAALIICRMVNLSLEHGNSDGSCLAYLGLAMIAGPYFGNYSNSVFGFGRLGYDLVEKRGLKRFRARTYAVFGNVILPWTRHVRTGRDLIRCAFDAANEIVDLTFAAVSRSYLVANLLASGDPLEEVQSEAENGLAFQRKGRYGISIDITTTQLALIRTLRGLTPKFGCLDDGQMDELRMEHHLSGSPLYRNPACRYWIRKMQARYLAGDCAAALDASSRAQRLLWTSPSHPETVEFYFHGALAHAASWDCAPPAEKQQHFEALTAHHKQLEIWARNCPENFENRAASVAAEIARIEGRDLEAMRLYEDAIRSARANGFVQNEALAYELAARFYAARGFEEFARVYVRHAREGYLRWGAVGKVRQLEELHPHLVEQERLSTSTIGAPVEDLDLATVIKVSQAVSGEMVLEKLIDTLMRTAIEHAGAERGLLILSRDAEQRIAAEATTSGTTVVVHKLDERVSSAALPDSVVHYVIRTQESVILGDAAAQNAFSGDPYIGDRHVRSVLCLPLSNRGKLIGVLYLENNLAPHVFAPRRVAMLKLLASQAAMSLENTSLYRDLAKREARIRRLVDVNVVGIYIWDLDGTILEANDAFLRMVGYEREELVSGRLRWIDLTPAEWLGRDRQELVAEVQRTGSVQPVEWEFIRKDGSRVPVLVAAASFEAEKQGVVFVLDLTDRKGVEQALRQSEAYLAEAQRLTHTGSWAFNLVTGKHTYYSDEAFRLFGLDPQSGRLPEFEEITRLIHPEDRDRVLAELAQVLRDKVEYEQDYRIVLPAGTVRHMHSIGHPVRDQAGERVEYFGTVLDVTERKRAEQRLLAQHLVARILAETVTVEEAMPRILQAVCECAGWHVGVRWRIDREAGVLRCADVWCKPSIDLTQFEAVTRTSTLRLGSGFPGRVWASRTPVYIPDVLHDPELYADTAARAGLRAAVALPILLGSEVLGVIGFFSRNVSPTEQNVLDVPGTIASQIGQFTKRAAAVDELQLRVSMLQHIPVAAWSVTPDGTPDIVNQLWFEYTGQTSEYVNSHPEAWMATIHPEDRERAAGIYWDGIRSGRGFTMEARFLRARDGTYRWHLNRAVAVRDSEGNILRFVGTSTDVHDWRQAQEELRNTQAELAHTARVLTMGELTASIAHEVNQPLGAIVTSAGACERWLAAKPPQIENARRALERIFNDGRRAGEVIKRIRALMKRQAPQKEWLQINEAILEVIAIAQHQLRRNDILLETQLAEGLSLVRGDRVQLQQVLLNLIVNAIEAMSGMDERRRELTIVSAADGPEAVAVEVRDSGTGLDPERAAHLFEPFYTTKAEGMGIGLSVSRSIVEAHGGQLSAAANVPHGAVFRFSVPLEEPVS
ncbi:MAG: AAA family ATPase [Steroidobacteraceae bacterium]